MIYNQEMTLRDFMNQEKKKEEDSPELRNTRIRGKH